MLRETTTEYGHIRGIAGNDPRITVFKGIPYAMPPVGELRWKAPVYGRFWERTLDAVRFAPISIQDQPGIGDDLYCREWHVDPDIKMSEDCLYLNIWTPANSTDEKLPVLVWYFGGAFQWGYTSEMEFNGERLARRGIIVVSVNYRIGAMGFMAHKDLLDEDEKDGVNFGLLDQRAGLRWVYENIDAFGGDPENITIAGQSAGGGSVLNQICRPDNYPMLKGAAIFSGIIRFPGDEILTPVPIDKACDKGQDFLDFLGLSSINEARKLDALYIRDKYAEYALSHARFVPCIDYLNYRDDPFDLFKDGDYADIPILTGYTTGEFLMEGINRVKSSVLEAGEALARSGKNNIYLYEFDAHMPGWDKPGVFHSSDLWFWFETLNMCWRPFGGAHYELASKMCDYFANFVKFHDPNGEKDAPGNVISWSAADKHDLNILKLTV